MLEGGFRVGPLIYKTVWFADRPSLTNSINLTSYRQSKYHGPCVGYVRMPFRTKIIDLNMSADELLHSFRPKTAIEIRKAQRQGVRFEIDNNLDRFIEFYNTAAALSRRASLKKRMLAFYGVNLVIAKATLRGESLVMHSYLIDYSERRVRGLQGASPIWLSGMDKGRRRLIGWANRFLHYEAMVYFGQRGSKWYDLGGYAAADSGTKLAGIDWFKDGFRGVLVEESDYVSYPLYVASHLRKAWRRLRKARTE
jgi:lipid II:glycine glycyltransferase (peptidoglycan interpeptide bridge formation enzyme)